GYAYRDYGNRVGLWRIQRLFAEFDIPLAIIVNASVYDACPEVLEPFRARGDEIIGHGRTNSEPQIGMIIEKEEVMLGWVLAMYTSEAGTPPRGWLGPSIAQCAQSPELLKPNGFDYMLDWFYDDQPTWFRTAAGAILAVPYPSMELNDLPAYV